MIDLSEVVLLSLHSPLATRSDTGVLLDRTAFCFWGLLQYRNRARPVNPDRRSSARDRANRDPVADAKQRGNGEGAGALQVALLPSPGP